jgi:hypothetical protein
LAEPVEYRASLRQEVWWRVSLKNTSPQRLKAAIDFEAFAARLGPRPFKTNSS